MPVSEPKTPSYPIFLNLAKRLVVVVGAGPIGRRKLAGLLQNGARVRLIDPCLVDESFENQAVEVLPRGFMAGDLAGAELVFACTNQPELNRQVVVEARRRGLFCCSATDPAEGDFFLPAVHCCGPLQLAVSTGGGSPAMAAQIRDRLAEQLPDSWGLAVEIIAAVRRKWLTEKSPNKYNQQVLRKFWEEQLVPALEAADKAAVDRLLQETFGEDYSLAMLDIQRPEGMP